MKKDHLEEPMAIYDGDYTYADYLKFTFEEMVELINGKIFRMSPAPNTYHQVVSRNLCGELYQYFKGKPCSFFDAPFDVILPKKGADFMQSRNVVQPDIVVICNSEIIREAGCFGAPDWVIEIISPHTRKKDLKNKFNLYEESGIGEYWIIEPTAHSVEVFTLKNNQYHRAAVYVEDDIAYSFTLPDFSVDLSVVFELQK